MDDALIQGLQAAVEAQPDNVELRLHLAQLLVAAGRGSEAVPHVATALQQQPDSEVARTLMARALGTPAPQRQGFDWTAAETDLGDVVAPMFVDGGGAETTPFDVEREHLTLADVGGMTEVKKRLNAARPTPRACAAGCCSTARPAAARPTSRVRSPVSSVPVS